MRIVKRGVLKNFAGKHPQARDPLDTWYEQIKAGEWSSPTDIKTVYGSNVDFVANNRANFNIKGNDYRLIAELNYKKQAAYVRFIGTHSEYDKVDAGTVKLY
jgi:mRNA interferase HigB